MTRVVRRVGVVSVGKIAAIVYACIGLLAGTVVALVSVVGGFAGMLDEGTPLAGALGLFLGVGAVIVLPVLYACIGALAWMVGALIYNLAARLAGGIEIEIE